MVLHEIINIIYRKVNNTIIYKYYWKVKIIFNYRNTVRVKLTNFWPTTEKELSRFPIFKLISKNVLITNFRPQIQLVSVFNKKDNIKKIKDCKTVFFTGEDCSHNFVDYADYCINISDLSIGFRYENEFKDIEKSHVLRYPLWLAYYGYFSEIDKDKIKMGLKEFEAAKNFSRNKFCALIASHDRWSGGIRGLLYDACSTIGEVKCPGKLFHNDDTLKVDYQNRKIDYLRQFKFNICPENYSVRGYVTEKIFDSLLAGAIPIYSGGEREDIEHDVLNQNIIIRYYGDNLQEVKEKIKFLENNDFAYKEFLKQQTFMDTAVDWIYERNMKLKEKVENLL